MSRNLTRKTREKGSPLPLLIAMLAVSLAMAAAFAAWQAMAGDDSAGMAERLRAFASSLLWPGAAIFAAVAAVMWAGWHLNLD